MSPYDEVRFIDCGAPWHTLDAQDQYNTIQLQLPIINLLQQHMMTGIQKGEKPKLGA